MGTVHDINAHRSWEMKCFGFDSPGGLERVPVPVGFQCAWCDETILPNEPGVWMQDGPCFKPWHRECVGRLMLGGIAHARRTCSCFGGTEEDLDPPGMTKRQAAMAADEERRLQYARDAVRDLGKRRFET
jgi:hypothetical protein